MLEWYWIILIIFVYKFINNLVKYNRCIYFKDQYVNFVLTATGGEKLLQSKNEVTELINGANVSNYTIPWTQPAGFGLINTMQPSVLGQFPSRIESFATTMTKMFIEAIGVYEGRMRETFSPNYWIQCVIFLPKKLLVYVGLPPENVIIKIMQMFWWLACLVGSVSFTLFKDNISAIVKKFLSNIGQ